MASVLGFGCMRLPTKGNDGEVDEDATTNLIRYAIDQGVNYIDTAYVYHGGKSELAVGKALKDGYRQKVKIATKLPPWPVQSYADFDRICNEQLRKLQVEHIELYLLHSLNKAMWNKFQDLNIFKWVDGALSDGRIGYIGFSFHDSFDVFKSIIDGHDRWSFCLIQLNYMSEDVQAGTRGLRYAASKGIPVVIMEPLLGGNLVNPPASVQELWNTAYKKRSPVDWALQWLWNKPEVAVVLSGINAIEQVERNVASADASGVGVLDENKLELVARVRDEYKAIRPVPCTECKYCMPCPHGVNIPRNFLLYNRGVMYSMLEQFSRYYQSTKEEARASACTQCGECLEKFPQEIEIDEWMIRIDEEMGIGAPS